MSKKSQGSGRNSLFIYVYAEAGVLSGAFDRIVHRAVTKTDFFTNVNQLVKLRRRVLLSLFAQPKMAL